MKKNVGSADKLIRLIIAVVLVMLYVTGVVSGTLGIIFLILAAVLVITSLISFCGLYPLLGINTCKTKK